MVIYKLFRGKYYSRMKQTHFWNRKICEKYILNCLQFEFLAYS